MPSPRLFGRDTSQLLANEPGADQIQEQSGRVPAATRRSGWRALLADFWDPAKKVEEPEAQAR